MKTIGTLILLTVAFVYAAPRPEPEPNAAFLAVDSSEEETSGNDEHDRKMLVGELIKMEAKMDVDIEKNDHYDIRYALVNLETRIAPRIAKLSKQIETALTSEDQRAGEYKFQRTLAEDIARIMYKAGARFCLSPEETYYEPESRCMKFGSHAKKNPCKKKNQILFDGKNNEGACDCVDDDRQLVFYEGECHIQNIQGPCAKGSWLVMTDGKPACQKVPVNCTADGRHIHWSPDSVKVKPECHLMGERGPCSIGQITVRDAKGGIKCIFPPVEEEEKEVAVEISVWDKSPCSVGSYRSQNGKCPV